MSIYYKIKEFGEKRYNSLMFISLFIYLFYVFNLSLTDILFKNHFILYMLFAICFFSLLVANLQYVDKKSIYKRKQLLIILIILALLILFRNGDIFHGHFGLPFCSVFSLFVIFILSFTNQWYKTFAKIFIIFIIEHVVFTFFSYLFPSFYFENILPLFPEYQNELLYQFNHNQIAGLTMHYSTNVIYLSIGFLFYYIKAIFYKNIPRKIRIANIVFCIFIFVCLLLTGKRSQVLYVLLICIITYVFMNKDKKKMMIKKVGIVSISSVVSLSILSVFIPSITNSFRRIFNIFSGQGVFSTRLVLYDFALKKFLERPIFGWGWANYKYLYNSIVVIKEREYMNAHCIYIQLLSEVGLIGFIFVSSLLIYLLVKSIKKLVVKRKKHEIVDYLFFAFHIFFLLEGFFGNSIYDAIVFMPYSIILSTYVYGSKKKVVRKNKK